MGRAEAHPSTWMDHFGIVFAMPNVLLPANLVAMVISLETQVLSAWPQAPDPAGADSAELARLEASLGSSLPDQLREWLLFRNGSYVTSEHSYSTEEIAHRAIAWSEIQEIFAGQVANVPAGIPVAGDGSGNEYRLRDDGHVFFIDHENFDWYVVSTSLWRFIELSTMDRKELRESEMSRWPFDRAWTLERDPDLADDPQNPWASQT